MADAKNDPIPKDAPEQSDSPPPLNSPEFKDAKTKLENKLLTRLTKADLFEKHILLSEASPSLHSTQAKLIQQKVADSLNKKISHRPTEQELLEKNILRSGTKVSSSLQGTQQQLRRERLGNDLSSKLQQRPRKDSLIQQNIIQELTDVEETTAEPTNNEKSEKSSQL